MDILFFNPGDDPAPWLDALSGALPRARLRVWSPQDTEPADYALVWKPPAEVLLGRRGLKAVFNLGAGVDALMARLRAQPQLLAPGVPIFKLDDAGMGLQMAHYVLHGVLAHHRRFDEYALQQVSRRWAPLPLRPPADCPVGLLGAGVLGSMVASALLAAGFPVRCWSRSGHAPEGAAGHAGHAQLGTFLDGLQVLVNLLPLTPETENILDRKLFLQLARGATLINVARGAHLVESELLGALDEGLLGGAILDVFRDEPLPREHPFWTHPRIRLTPHIAAQTLVADSVAQIAERIALLERGQPVGGMVIRERGY